MTQSLKLSITVNGKLHQGTVEPRLLLSDFLRHELGLTGTHVGCEHGSCGACTILLDGVAVRSCILFAIQADGHAVTTIEGVAPDWTPDQPPEALHPLQVAFRNTHGLQCGYCTPGFVMTLLPFLDENPNPTDEEIRSAISGNICRCTGYQNIVRAVRQAVDQRVDAGGGGG